MPSEIGFLPLLALSAAVAFLFAYGAYWGLRVRAVLLDRLYKSQAQWVSIVAIVFATLVISNLLIGGLASSNWYLSLLQFVLEYAGAALTFASVDASIRVAVKSDPLQRDTLHWRTLRKMLWTVVLVTIAGGLAGVIILRTNFYSSPGGPQGVLVYGPFGNVLALIALLIARGRSKDYTLRRHMKWFSMFVLILIIASSDPIYHLAEAQLIVSGLLSLGGFFLIRGCKIPRINRKRYG